MKLSNKLKILIIVFTIILQVSVKSQDIHFSQPYSSPLSLNPAFTGNYKGNWRVMNNYRNQWSAIGEPYKTISFGADKPFTIVDNKFAAGLFIINDNSGASKLTLTKFYLCAAYHNEKPESSLHFGFNAGYVQNKLTKDKLSFPNQFNPEVGLFQSSYNQGADNLTESINYYDINIGGIYTKKFEKFEPEVGVSLFHVNFPKVSYLSENSKLALRQCIHGSLIYSIDEKIFLTPKVIYIGQKNAAEVIVGTDVGYNLPKNSINAKSVYAGLFMRQSLVKSDACVLVIGAHLKSLDVGLSYDINVSKLHTATKSRGAFEFSIIFSSASIKTNKIAIPIERF